jgi:uncharacterized protein (DUF58 family)
VADYIVDLGAATRAHAEVRLGASPRASLALLHSAQAHAVVSGRHYVAPDDVKAVAAAVLAHRLILAGGPDRVGGTAVVRAVLDLVTAELDGAGPLGLVTWRRRVGLPLAAPLEVGPTPAAVKLGDFVGLGTGVSSAAARGAIGHDTVRGVRAYATGDPIRIVHWPATARWGEVMVKEMEDPTPVELVIVVDLRGQPDRTEAAASIAAGLARAGLNAGLAVSLLTAEAGGPRAGPVSSGVHAGRRLARAVADAQPAEPPQGAPRVVRVTAT